jgi:putative hydrolase of HD superfamily
MTESIDNLLDFVSFTHEIRNVKRSMWVLNEKQFENDSEHGYQLAVTALYIIEENKLQLDTYKAMALATVHDILEVHAGDTPVFGDTKDIETQKEREAKAVVELKRQWPKLKLLHELIDEYESRTTHESKFVYALDKLLPILNNYLDNGRNWKHWGVTLQDIVSVKTGKVDVDSTIKQYYEEILKLIDKKPDLFI